MREGRNAAIFEQMTELERNDYWKNHTEFHCAMVALIIGVLELLLVKNVGLGLFAVGAAVIFIFRSYDAFQRSNFMKYRRLLRASD